MNMPFIKKEDLDQGSKVKISTGQFGTVYRGYYRGGQVALKYLNLAGDSLGKLLKEYETLYKVMNHSNVVRLIGCCKEVGEECLVMEYVSGGSLFRLIQRIKRGKERKLSPEHKFEILRGAAAGLHHLHSEGVIHRDVASRNFLITKSLDCVKVTDLGMAFLLEGTHGRVAKETLQSIRMVAPETVTTQTRQGEFSTKSDVWSFACFIYEFMELKEPYGEILENIQVLKGLIGGKLRPRSPRDWNFHLKALCDRCWSSIPYERPEMSEILNQMNHILNEFKPLNRSRNSTVSSLAVTPTYRRRRESSYANTTMRGENNGAYFKFTPNSLFTPSAHLSSPNERTMQLADPIFSVPPSIVVTEPIHYTEIKLLQVIGEGRFGLVYKGRWRGATVAVKKLHKDVTQKTVRDLYKEYEVFLSIGGHPNVVQFLGCVLEKGHECLVMQYVKGGTLLELNTRVQEGEHPALSYAHKIDLLHQISAGILHLHMNNIIHRDIALRNILIASDNKSVKVTDFGMSRHLEGQISTSTVGNLGPIKWMSPENMNQEYSDKSDIWAFACLIYEFLEFEPPFPELNHVQVFTGLMTGNIHPEPKDNWPPFLADLATRCWMRNPEDRPPMKRIEQDFTDFEDQTNVDTPRRITLSIVDKDR